MIHIPTGLIETRQSKSRNSNFKEAKEALIEKLKNHDSKVIYSELSKTKKDLLGSGQRGDKLLTIQFQHDRVNNHQNNKSCRAQDFMNGKMELLW